MYYYFSSAFPAAIKLNGIYYGVISDTIKQINLEGELPLVEICPLSDNQRQITFFPNADFLCSPPADVLITDLRGGYLIKFLKNIKSGDFRIIEQKRFDNFLATIFIENGLKVSIETRNNFFADTLDLSASNAEINQFSLNNNEFCGISFKGEDNPLAIYHLSNDVKRVFLRSVSDYSFDGGFFTTENFLDIAKHKVMSEWDFSINGFSQKNIHVERAADFDISSLNEKIIPFAFLEELLVGGTPSDFLTDSLKENVDKLKGYLGNFIGIMPPPIFRSPDEIGLIFPDGKNKYKVEYCTFLLDSKLVYNIKKTE